MPRILNYKFFYEAFRLGVIDDGFTSVARLLFFPLFDPMGEIILCDENGIPYEVNNKNSSAWGNGTEPIPQIIQAEIGKNETLAILIKYFNSKDFKAAISDAKEDEMYEAIVALVEESDNISDSRAICAKTFIHEIYTKREYNEKKEMVKMLHNEARKLLVEGYERTHDVHGIAKAYGVTEREVYRLVKQKRDTGSVELRTSQRGRKPKMTEKDLERLRAAIEKTPDKTLGELKEELNLPCSESRLSRIVREKLGFRRKKKVIHASEQERPRCTGKA